MLLSSLLLSASLTFADDLDQIMARDRIRGKQAVAQLAKAMKRAKELESTSPREAVRSLAEALEEIRKSNALSRWSLLDAQDVLREMQMKLLPIDVTDLAACDWSFTSGPWPKLAELATMNLVPQSETRTLQWYGEIYYRIVNGR